MASGKLLFRKKNSFCAVLFLFFLSSCAYQTGSSSDALSDASVVGSESNSTTQADAPPLSMHLAGYDDIEIPVEMEVVKSMAIRTASFRGGIHETKGSVELLSLRDYIEVSMLNNKWKLAGEANYDKIMLAFTKETKACMVVLGKTYSKTYANFYVTADLGYSSNLDAFGGAKQ